MFNKLGVQLYSIRDFMKTENDVRESFKKLKAMGYDQAQTAGCAIPYETFGELAEKEGIEIVGTHDNFDKMKYNLPQAIKDHKALHTTNMGIGGFMVHSMEEIRGLIENANELAAKLAKEGFKFTYHNHSHEFRKFNGKTAMDYFIEEFDKDNISFVLDTYWVQHAGADVLKTMKRMAGRIDILHLKDMAVKDNDPFITECGNGNLNFDEIIPLAEEIGVKYYVVEQDYCPGDPFESIKQSSDYFHKHFMK